MTERIKKFMDECCIGKDFFFFIPKTSYMLVEREWALRISERNN